MMLFIPKQGSTVYTPKRILIYRLGSLGDTVVTLPALKLIAKSFPNAERFMLTNFSIGSKAAPVSKVLEGTGLIHGYIEYPMGVRNLRSLSILRQEIRQLHPDVLIYLAASRGGLKVIRDAAFFRACGIHTLIGVPYSKADQQPRELERGRYEYEGERLLRCLRQLGKIDLENPESFDLSLSDNEHIKACKVLEPIVEHRPFIVASIGAKAAVKDWGNDNWLELLERLSQAHPGSALVLIGAQVEHTRSDVILSRWSGAGINLCGSLSVRESAAVLEQADVFIGHDSGPMHLASAVNTTCVAIFSSHNLPGEWFPYGDQHQVLYKSVPCQGCRQDVCAEHDNVCIGSIGVDEVLNRVEKVLMENKIK